MVTVNGKMYPIFDFKKPKNQNYIVLEVMGMPVGKNFSVVKIPDNYMLEIGRSNSEINIPDVSVSKKQATLKYDLSIGELVIIDTNSKYGTHILIQRPLTLFPNKPVFVSNGLSLLRLELLEDKRFLQKLLCCLAPSKPATDNPETAHFYENVKHDMPSDLITYVQEKESNPALAQISDTSKY